MRTTVSSCLAFIHYGQNHSTNRLLVLVLHEGTHGTVPHHTAAHVQTEDHQSEGNQRGNAAHPNSLSGAEGASYLGSGANALAQLACQACPAQLALPVWQSM